MGKTFENSIENIKMVCRVVVLAAVFAACVMGFGVEAEAAIATGTNGTCSWEIDDAGQLRIWPTDGVSGTLASHTSVNASDSGPWYDYRSSLKSIIVEQGVKAGDNCYRLFYGLSNCVSMDLHNLDTSNTTIMKGMFRSCGKLSSLDVSGWNVEKVIYMDSMFYSCSVLPALDLSGWNAKKTTNMSYMFYSCKELASLNLFGFNTVSATDMSYMFYGCSKLTSVDVSGFNTSGVTKMQHMFRDCSKLTTLNVSGFDTRKVTNMDSMFYNCSKLTSLDVSIWNTENATSMSSMFSGCSSLATLDVSGWDTKNVTRMSSMFSGCSSLTNLDVSGFNTEKVTGMTYMFSRCSKLTDLDVSGFNTSNVTNMTYMFESCSKLTSLDVSEFNTDKVTDMSAMFSDCSGITSLDVSGFNTSNVTKMANMFNKCSNIANLDVSGFNTDKVTNMCNMFNKCSSITSLDVSGFNTSIVTNMSGMFNLCSNLTSLDVSNFNTSNTTDISGMFSDCSNLTSLDVSGFNTGKVTNMRFVFRNCSKITNINVSGFNTDKVTDMAEMFNGCSELSQVNLGPKFSFKGKNISSASSQARLPTPPQGTTTGKWIKEDESAGPFTPAELRDNYTPAMSGVWVWQEIQTAYKLTFIPPETPSGVTGSMPIQKIEAGQPGTINRCLFQKYNYHFDHWNGSDGNTYADEQEIPANTIAAGTKITLTAVLEKDDNTITFEDGVADVYLKRGEKLSIPEIPGGASYTIMEETPEGWQLVNQVNPAGEVPANGTADAVFTNEYVPDKAFVQFIGTKRLDNHSALPGAFSFALYEDNNELERVPTSDGGFIQFSEIEYEESDIGTHTYTIKEINPNNAAIDYDQHEETITVEVAKDENNKLTATATYDEDGIAFFNKTRPGILKVTKNAVGTSDANKDDLFTFRIELHNENGTPIGADEKIYWYIEE